MDVVGKWFCTLPLTDVPTMSTAITSASTDVVTIVFVAVEFIPSSARITTSESEYVRPAARLEVEMLHQGLVGLLVRFVISDVPRSVRNQK